MPQLEVRMGSEASRDDICTKDATYFMTKTQTCCVGLSVRMWIQSVSRYLLKEQG